MLPIVLTPYICPQNLILNVFSTILVHAQKHEILYKYQVMILSHLEDSYSVFAPFFLFFFYASVLHSEFHFFKLVY